MSHDARRDGRSREPDRQPDREAGEQPDQELLPSINVPYHEVSTNSNRPAPRRVPSEPRRDMCIVSMTTLPETVPFYERQGMVTVKLQQVDRIGKATLYCDCLHDGFHEWPPSIQPIRIAPDATLPTDGVDDREKLI